MKRQVSLEEISDGKLYGRNDMVRVCTGGCRGCSSCCSGMGNSVILDPLDIYRLTVGLGFTFGELMTDKIELNVVDGVILPNLKMGESSAADSGGGRDTGSAAGPSNREDTGSGTCAFLDGEGRCSIHAQRPGICRLFPLGRYYPPAQEGPGTDVSDSCGSNQGTDVSGPCGSGQAARRARGFRYFLQIHECPAPNRTKIKISRWIDTPEPERYERFVNDWHYFLEDVQERLGRESDEKMKQINLLLLKLFYVSPYQEGDFYGQFEKRLAAAKEALGFPASVRRSGSSG